MHLHCIFVSDEMVLYSLEVHVNSNSTKQGGCTKDRIITSSQEETETDSQGR